MEWGPKDEYFQVASDDNTRAHFQIARHWAFVCNDGTKIADSNGGVLEFFSAPINWVVQQLTRGENVLVHCLAGAHRAGTMGIALLMNLAGMDALSATKTAKM